MVRIALATICLLTATACLPGCRLVPLTTARDPARDVSTWPAADAALQSASAAMSQLTTLRERVSTRTYRNDELFLSVDAERAYVAPESALRESRGTKRRRGGGRRNSADRRSLLQAGGQGGRLAAVRLDRIVRLARSRVHLRRPAQRELRLGRATWTGTQRGSSYLCTRATPRAATPGWQFQTRLWIDPATNYFLRRETTGTREEPDLMAGKPLVQRDEGTWTYTNHDGSIAISAPLGPD